MVSKKSRLKGMVIINGLKSLEEKDMPSIVGYDFSKGSDRYLIDRADLGFFPYRCKSNEHLYVGPHGVKIVVIKS
jgi:hypothetical protein